MTAICHKTWIHPSRHWPHKYKSGFKSQVWLGLDTIYPSQGYKDKAKLFLEPWLLGWHIVLKFVGVTWPQILTWFRSRPGVLCGDYLPLAGLPPRQHAHHCPLDMSSRVRANILYPLRFEITGKIWSNSTERQFRWIFCNSCSVLNFIYCIVSLDEGKAVQGMWRDSNPVKLVPPWIHVALLGCLKLPHSEMFNPHSPPVRDCF